MKNSKTKYKLIILDRDGVINEDSEEYIKSPAEWHAISGSLEAIAKLNQAGIKVAVATNQSGIGRGMFNLETLHAIHAKMEEELAKHGGHIDMLLFCPHHPNDNCECRKPNAKMLREIMLAFGIAPNETLFIGDNFRDLQAARNVGCDMILVRTGKGERILHQHKKELKDIPVFQDLAEAVKKLGCLTNNSLHSAS